METNNEVTRADIVEIEHRMLKIWSNFIKYGFSNDKPLKKASRIALITWLLSPSNNVTRASVLFSILTLFIALHANKLIVNQNAKIDLQNQLIESQRRASLNFELSEIQNLIYSELKGHIKDSKKQLEKNSVQLTPMLQGRIIAISSSLQPYRQLEPSISPTTHFTDSISNWEYFKTLINVRDLENIFSANETGKLTDIKSPERAQLLISLIHSGAKYTPFISQVSLDYISLDQMDFSDVSFGALNVSNGSFIGTDLRSSILDSATLTDNNFKNAIFTNANFNKSHISENDFHSVSMAYSTFTNCWISQDFSMTNSFNNTYKKSYFYDSKFSESFDGSIIDNSVLEDCLFQDTDSITISNSILINPTFSSISPSIILKNVKWVKDGNQVPELANGDAYIGWNLLNDKQRNEIFTNTVNNAELERDILKQRK